MVEIGFVLLSLFIFLMVVYKLVFTESKASGWPGDGDGFELFYSHSNHSKDLLD